MNGIGTSEQLMTELGTLLQQYVSTKETAVVEVAASATRLVVGTRDDEGIRHYFRIEVSETKEAPLPPDLARAQQKEAEGTEEKLVTTPPPIDPDESKDDMSAPPKAQE